MTNLTNFNNFALNTEQATNVNGGGCRRRRRTSYSCYSYNTCYNNYSSYSCNDYSSCNYSSCDPVEEAPVEIAPEVIETPVIENRAPLAGIAGA